MPLVIIPQIIQPRNQRIIEGMSKVILISLSCLLFVTACGTKKTGVAKYPESDKKVKASQRPYTVNGQRYEPIQSHEGFVQTGIASWYGKDFTARQPATANSMICMP